MSGPLPLPNAARLGFSYWLITKDACAQAQIGSAMTLHRTAQHEQQLKPAAGKLLSLCNVSFVSRGMHQSKQQNLNAIQIFRLWHFSFKSKEPWCRNSLCLHSQSIAKMRKMPFWFLAVGHFSIEPIDGLVKISSSCGILFKQNMETNIFVYMVGFSPVTLHRP